VSGGTRRISILGVVLLGGAVAYCGTRTGDRPPAGLTRPPDRAPAADHAAARSGERSPVTRSPTVSSERTQSRAAPDSNVRPIQDLPQELRDPVQRPLDKYRFGCERLGITAARGDPRISMPSAKAVVEALEELDRAQARQSNVLSDTLRSRFQTADPSERIDNGDEEAMAARYPGSPDGYYWYRTKGQAMAWKIEGGRGTRVSHRRGIGVLRRLPLAGLCGAREVLRLRWRLTVSQALAPGRSHAVEPVDVEVVGEGGVRALRMRSGARTTAPSGLARARRGGPRRRGRRGGATR
jgi:hypothetical protein